MRVGLPARVIGKFPEAEGSFRTFLSRLSIAFEKQETSLLDKQSGAERCVFHRLNRFPALSQDRFELLWVALLASPVQPKSSSISAIAWRCFTLFQVARLFFRTLSRAMSTSPCRRQIVPFKSCKSASSHSFFNPRLIEMAQLACSKARSKPSSRNLDLPQQAMSRPPALHRRRSERKLS